MRLEEIPQEETVEVMEMIVALTQLITKKCGAPQDVVILVHETHAQGCACGGVAVLTQVTNPKVTISMLDQALDGALEVAAQMEACRSTTTLN